MLKHLILIAALCCCTAAMGAKKTTKTTLLLMPPTYALWKLDSGEYITGSNAVVKRPMASMTKIMSAMVILNSDLDLDEVLLVTGRESSRHIRSGMLITRGKLLELTLISSDNLAARTLAETHPAGYLAFLDLMNSTATELGMTETKYADATGLLNTNISTPADIRKLLTAAQGWNIFTLAANAGRTVLDATAMIKHRAKTLTIVGKNTNDFVGKLDIVAAKTGYTSTAGRCLAMVFNQGQSRYFLVVMGAQSSRERTQLVEQMLNKIK